MEELVKILRTTHLSLLGTMLALAVAWSVSSDVILSEAVEQGREVELLDAVLHRDAMVRFGTSIETRSGPLARRNCSRHWVGNRRGYARVYGGLQRPIASLTVTPSR